MTTHTPPTTADDPNLERPSGSGGSSRGGSGGSGSGRGGSGGSGSGRSGSGGSGSGRSGSSRSGSSRGRSSSKKNTVRRDVQGLRALAVVVVILNHLTGWPTGGFVGVDVFFVLSGYLITGLLLREYERSNTISFTGFYRRRIKRILPSALLVLVVTLIAAYFLTPGVRFARTLVDGIWALLFSANWNLAIQGTDYFQQDVQPSPFQHYWSLAVEEQFYFVWPWLMLAVLALGMRRWGWGLGRSRTAVGIVIGVLTLASFGYALSASINDTNWAYFSSFSRAWELGLGALVAIFGAVFTSKSVAVRTVLSWLGLAGIVVSFFVIDPAQGFPAPAAALPVLCTGLVLVAGEKGTQPFLFPLTNAVSQYLGNISYSLYLWHFPVIILLLAVLPDDDPAYYAISAAGILILSVLGYHLVEDPIRKSTWLTVVTDPKLRYQIERKKRHRRRALKRLPWRSLLLMAATGVIAITLVVVAVRVQSPAVTSAVGDGSASSIEAGENSLKAQAEVNRCLGAPTRDPNSGCSTVDLGDTVYPLPADAPGDKALVDGKELCWIATTGTTVQSCHYGSNSKDALRVAVVGDSHAQHLLPAFLKEAYAADWSIDAYVGDGCLLSTELTDKCGEMQPQVLSKLVSEKYDLVITQASRNKGVGSEGFADAFRQIVAAGSKLAVIGDEPTVSAEAILCYQRVNFNVHDNDCQTPRSEVNVDPLIAATAETPGAQFIDLMSFFCDDTTCPAVIGNVVVYRDTGAHITQTYARTLSPYLMAAIKTQTGV